jgi:hypothetical protein
MPQLRGAGPATAPLFAFRGENGTPGRVYHSPHGALAQLGERLVCNQEVAGSIPAGSISRPGP